VEFGGGTGDFAAMFRDFGYSGTYLIYDLPPQLPYVRHWLRYSGVPAYLGLDFSSSPEAVQGRTMLVSSLSDVPTWAHIDHARLRDSMFWAAESFSEAAIEVREAWRPLLNKFGFILMSFNERADYGDYDNVPYLQDLVKHDLQDFHVLVWRGAPPANHEQWWYFAAVHKSHGNVKCLETLGCSRDSMSRWFHNVE